MLTTLRLLQKLLLYYYYSNVFPQTERKISSKIVEHKIEEAFSDSIPGDVQQWRLISLNFPFSQQLPRPISLSFFSFPKWPLKFNCTFRWQQSGDFEQLTKSES